MLVLTRTPGEKIIIGSGEDAIEVSVEDIRGGKVRLGIKAPEHVPVHRQEVFEAIAKETGGVVGPGHSRPKTKR